jgi:60s Acidic ribosomal protein
LADLVVGSGAGAPAGAGAATAAGAAAPAEETKEEEKEEEKEESDEDVCLPSLLASVMDNANVGFRWVSVSLIRVSFRLTEYGGLVVRNDSAC